MLEAEDKIATTNAPAALPVANQTNSASTTTGNLAGPAGIFRLREQLPVTSLFANYETQTGNSSQTASIYTAEELHNWELQLPTIDAFAQFKKNLEDQNRGSLNAGDYKFFNQELSAYAKQSLVPHPALRGSLPDISIFSQPIDECLLIEDSEQGDAYRAEIKKQSENFAHYILRYSGKAGAPTAEEIESHAVDLSNITTKDALKCNEIWKSGWPQHYAARYVNYSDNLLGDRIFALEEDKTGSILCSARWAALLERDAKMKASETKE